MKTQASVNPATPPAAVELLDFWRKAGETRWFSRDDEFDRTFRERFLALYRAAARSDLAGWTATPVGALGLVILLDQFPRNAFRGTAEIYATDALARDTAEAAIAAGHDRRFGTELRGFFYMPFMHSEDLADQERSVSLQRELSWDWRRPAARHRDIIKRFGRFPHRNAVLGRVSTPEEKRYLDEGGFSG